MDASAPSYTQPARVVSPSPVHTSAPAPASASVSASGSASSPALVIIKNGDGDPDTNRSPPSIENGHTANESAAKTPRRRNKPSLSCETCTVKKTKCDRARPVCFACIKRRSDCHYSQLANLIEESHRSADGHKSRRKSKPELTSAPPPPSIVSLQYRTSKVRIVFFVILSKTRCPTTDMLSRQNIPRQALQ